MSICRYETKVCSTQPMYMTVCGEQMLSICENLNNVQTNEYTTQLLDCQPRALIGQDFRVLAYLCNVRYNKSVVQF